MHRKFSIDPLPMPGGAFRAPAHVIPAVVAAAALVVSTTVSPPTTGRVHERVALPLDQRLLAPTPGSNARSNASVTDTKSPLLDFLAELHAAVSDDEWARMPTNIASSVDETVYGG